jgi:hypothetical protein
VSLYAFYWVVYIEVAVHINLSICSIVCTSAILLCFDMGYVISLLIKQFTPDILCSMG